jgi:hypothetical protein
MSYALCDQSFFVMTVVMTVRGLNVWLTRGYTRGRKELVVG